MNEEQKLIEEQFNKLPTELQEAIRAVPWKVFAQEIGKQKGLEPEQIASLEQETMFIIYAFEKPEDYITNIVREVGVSEDVASTIAESVAGKIFKPILEKSDEKQNPPAPNNLPVGPSVPEIAPEIHPAKRQNLEISNETVPVAKDSINQAPGLLKNTQKEGVSLPDYRYPNGSDPYREPLK